MTKIDRGPYSIAKIRLCVPLLPPPGDEIARHLCDRAEAAEARVAELEREQIHPRLHDRLHEVSALAARYREALEGMAERVRSHMCCDEDSDCDGCDAIDEVADAIAAHVAEVLK